MDDLPEAAPSNPWHWFPEFYRWNRQRLRERARLMGSALLIGVVAGLGAAAFSLACDLVVHFALDIGAGYRPVAPHGEPISSWLGVTDTPLRPWMFLIVPTIGGLLCGLLVYTLAPEAEGHGTDAAISAYHQQKPIRFIVPYVKIVASALTLGTGGAGGREGPIAQVGAGFGSFWAGLWKMGPMERRILTAAGMGAGIAAIFRAPLAGSLFAAEVLYWSPEFEPEVIVPAGIASVSAYSVFGSFYGWKPLLEVNPPLQFNNPLQLGPYLVLAVFLAILAMLFTRTFYFVTYLFHRLPIVPHLKPAIGAFLTGAIGLSLYFALGNNTEAFSVLSFGYGVLQDAVYQRRNLDVVVLLAVALGRILTTALTIGSGGSAGVFGSSMVIGGSGGGAVGFFFHSLWPELVPHPASFVVVGMAGFFAAAAKTPFSTLVMVGELTGNYGLLLPTLWVCTLSFVLSDRRSIYHAQVESRAQSPAHQGEYIRQILGNLPVSALLAPDDEVPPLRPGDSLATILQCFHLSRSLALPVADADGSLLGLIHLDDVHIALEGTAARPLILAIDLVREDRTALLPDDLLVRAAELFMNNDRMALPVLDKGEPPRVVGIVRRIDIARACLDFLKVKAGT